MISCLHGKNYFILFALIITVFALTSCGSEKMNNVAITTQVPDSASVDGTNNKMKLTIYCEEDQPREYINEEGFLSGMAVDIVREIQKRVGNTDKIEMVPWARGYANIQNNPNVVLFSMARNAERDGMFQWVGPIDEISYAFYSRADSKLNIKSLADAKKVKAIGVINDEIRDIYLTGQGFTNLDRVDNTAQNYKKLMSGRIDLMPISTDKVELESEARELGFKESDFKQGLVFMKIQLYIAVSKDTPPEIVKAWNEALEEMKKDGTFERIYTKTFPEKPLPGPAITDF